MGSKGEVFLRLKTFFSSETSDVWFDQRPDACRQVELLNVKGPFSDSDVYTELPGDLENIQLWTW